MNVKNLSISVEIQIWKLQSMLVAETKTILIYEYRYVKIYRCEQGSNLRGETPLDFKSNALTTRPSQL